MLVQIHVHNIKSQICVYDDANRPTRFPDQPSTDSKAPLAHPVVLALDKELCYYVEVMIGRMMRQVAVKRFSVKTYKFDTGCISYVTKILSTFQVVFQIVDKRTPVILGTPIPLREGTVLRPYQVEAVEKGLKAQRGVLKLATGAGKTVIAAALIGRLALRTVVFVHTIDLLEQFKESLEFFLNTPCGQIGGGIIDPQMITVVMMQTSCKAFDEKYVKYEYDPDADHEEDSAEYAMHQKAQIRNTIEQAQVVISDECHHVSCATLQTLFKKAQHAFYRYGLTATLREDGADLVIHGVTGKVIHEVSASFLIENKFLVQPTIYYIKVKKPVGSTGAYHSRYKTDIVENDIRNDIIIQSAMKLVLKGYKVLVLAQQIKHLKLLKQAMEDGYKTTWPELVGANSAAINTELATGQVNKVERRRIIAAMKKGKLECMLASTIADEGLDCPPISAVILAGGGKSATKAFQRVGRALRLYEDENGVKKDRAIIIDFYDQGKYFKKHAERRMALFKKEPQFLLKIQQ